MNMADAKIVAKNLFSTIESLRKLERIDSGKYSKLLKTAYEKQLDFWTEKEGMDKHALHDLLKYFITEVNYESN